MKTILYATDFSENAEHAFPYALQLARAHEARLVMLHVFEMPMGWNYPLTEDFAVDRKAVAEQARGLLRSLYLKHHPTGEEQALKVDYLATDDLSVQRGILKVLTKTRADLLVLGTRGGSLLQEIMVGSTTKAMVRNAPCPVLAIPSAAVFKGFEKVVYASDFQEEDLEALRRLVGLLRPFEPEIIVTHVSTTPLQDTDKESVSWFDKLLRQQISYQRLRVQPLVWYSIYERLQEYVDHEHPNLMVMLKKERTGLLEHLFAGDLVTRVEFHSTIPVLSFHERSLRGEQAETGVSTAKTRSRKAFRRTKKAGDGPEGPILKTAPN